MLRECVWYSGNVAQPEFTSACPTALERPPETLAKITSCFYCRCHTLFSYINLLRWARWMILPTHGEEVVGSSTADTFLAVCLCVCPFSWRYFCLGPVSPVSMLHHSFLFNLITFVALFLHLLVNMFKGLIIIANYERINWSR